MVALIEDYKAETIAPAFQMDVSGVVGRDGELLKIIVAAAQESYRNHKCRQQLIVPLVQKVDGGRENDRRPGGSLDRHDREMGFSGSGGKNYYAAGTLAPPGFQRFDLVWERISAGSQRPRSWLVASSVVLVLDPILSQVLDNGPIVLPFRAVSFRSRIQPGAW
jgi:hypothetical protein